MHGPMNLRFLVTNLQLEFHSQIKTCIIIVQNFVRVRACARVRASENVSLNMLLLNVLQRRC
jgi:hypothetical protein